MYDDLTVANQMNYVKSDHKCYTAIIKNHLTICKQIINTELNNSC